MVAVLLLTVWADGFGDSATLQSLRHAPPRAPPRHAPLCVDRRCSCRTKAAAERANATATAARLPAPALEDRRAVRTQGVIPFSFAQLPSVSSAARRRAHFGNIKD